jgi:hypothetical protein
MTARQCPAMTIRCIVVLAMSMACACQVCVDDAACDVGSVCREGACVASTLPPSPTLRLLSPASPDVAASFDVVVEVSFQAADAVVTLDRSDDAPGEPCVPWLPREQHLAGDADAVVTQQVTFAAVPSLGSRFSLRAQVSAGATTALTIPLAGPALSFAGVRVREPSDVDSDAISSPWTIVEVEAAGAVKAWTEPRETFAPPTPSVSLQAVGGGRSVGRVPTLRGPQIVWAETTTVDDVVIRCGVGRVGRGEASIATPSAIEVVVLSASNDGKDQLVEVLTRVSGDGDASFCSGRFDTAVPCELVRPARVGAEGIDAVVVDMPRGMIEIAAVPRMISGPVTVSVRVARGDQHVAWWGPRTIDPVRGEVWLAGRVIVDDVGVRAIADASPPSVGLPW